MKRTLALAISFTFTVLAASRIQAQTRPAPQIVGGTIVPPDVQMQFGLLRLTNPEGSCSASMLNNYWAITAAHCVYAKDGTQFQPGQISLKANWPGNTKTAQALQIVAYGDGTAAPYDIALLQTGLYDFPRGVPDVKLEAQPPVSASTVTIYGQGINVLASGSGNSATPVQIDGRFRVAQFDIAGIPGDGTTFSYSGQNGSTVAGGDSGGPALIQDYDDDGNLDWYLLGVTSHARTTCLEGKDCSKDPWQWVSDVQEGTDAAIYPVRDNVLATIQQVPAPNNFIGKFGTTPKDYQPVWVYVIEENGNLRWYRKDTNNSSWEGPAIVGNSWQDFLDVIPAGGNRFYAIQPDGTLLWFQHKGFNNGRSDWMGPFVVGSGWDKFRKVFSGGDGILYALRQDGVLEWYRNYAYESGGANWVGPKYVGWFWNQYKDVFSMGQGIIYTVDQNGQMYQWRHTGYANGDNTWEHSAMDMGKGWKDFSKFMPCGGGVILAIKPDGSLYWYRHDNYQSSQAPILQGPIQIGSGWTGFRNVFSLLPQAVIQGPN